MHDLTRMHNRKNQAFTLVELMVAATIVGLVMVGAVAMTIEGLKIYSYDSNKLMVNGDMRKFTQAMSTDAAFANDFYIYDPDTNGAIPASGSDYVSVGNSGDDLLLVTIQTDAASGTTSVIKLIAYYRTVTDTKNNAGPLYRIEVDNPKDASGTKPAPGNTSIDELWSANIKPKIASQTATFMTSVIGTGGYNTTSAKPQVHLNLFYNAGTFIMVRAQIQEQGYNGGTKADTNLAKAIDTYNFSIWPRG